MQSTSWKKAVLRYKWRRALRLPKNAASRKKSSRNTRVIAAGGVFTGSDAVDFLEKGCAAVQVATRFTVAKECGIPEKVQQEYFKASEQDIEVNMISPTGDPMRMLKN